MSQLNAQPEPELWPHSEPLICAPGHEATSVPDSKISERLSTESSEGSLTVLRSGSLVYSDINALHLGR